MQAKNAEIVAINGARDAQWLDYLRSERDRFAGKLERAMMHTAPQRWMELKAAHAYAHPHEGMLNGRAIFLAVAAYLPTVDAESNALMHTKCIEWMRDNPLPDNATADQYTKRFTELAIKHRPFAETPLLTEAYVKLCLRAIPPGLATDKRRLKRDLRLVGHLEPPSCHRPTDGVA